MQELKKFFSDASEKLKSFEPIIKKMQDQLSEPHPPLYDYEVITLPNGDQKLVSKLRGISDRFK